MNLPASMSLFGLVTGVGGGEWAEGISCLYEWVYLNMHACVWAHVYSDMCKPS